MTAEKKDYEIAIDAFLEAEKKYKALEESFLNGDAVQELVERTIKHGSDVFKEKYRALIETLQSALEDMNVKGVAAKNALRAAVVLAPSQQRGPDGKPTTLAYGPLEVTSTTRRWFDADSLIKLATRAGVWERIIALKTLDRDGKEKALVEMDWKIDYEHLSKWLKDNGHEVILNGAYDEKEMTPRVSGIKAIAFLGDKIDKP